MALHITKMGTLKRKENTVYLETEKGEKIPIPIEQVDEVYFHAPVSLSSQVMFLFSKKGIVLHFYDYYGFYKGSFYPKETLLSGEVLVRQADHYLNKEKRTYLAKQFVKGAMKNMGVNLRVWGFDVDVERYVNEVSKAQDINQVMSVEGKFRDMYYSKMDERIIHFGFEIGVRTKRPPKNEGNALLSFLNSLVYSSVVAQIYYTHLSPTISFLHEPSYRRFSLALDIAEIFKPIISERLFMFLISKKVISLQDFRQESKGILLKENSSRKVLKYFEERISSTIKHKTLRRKVSHKRLIRLEVYKLEKHFLGLQKYKPLVAWW